MDSCNQYSALAHDVFQAVYGILHKAGIVKEFATLLSIIMPLPADECSTRHHMQPLKYLSATSSHTNWIMGYFLSNELCNNDDP
jgi:hypothetical protein